MKQQLVFAFKFLALAGAYLFTRSRTPKHRLREPGRSVLVLFLLENLKRIVVCNAGLIHDSRNQVEYLENEVRLFKAFLKDFSRIRVKDTVAEAFAGEVRGVVSEADGVIVRYLNREAEIRHRNFFQRTIAGPVGLIGVAKEVRAMRARVKVMYGKSVAVFASQRTVRPPAG